MYLQVKFVLLATHYFTNSIIKVRMQDREQLHGGPCNPPPPLRLLRLGLFNKEVGGWDQKMAIFADLQYYLC